jgi:hypothetical protein
VVAGIGKQLESIIKVVNAHTVLNNAQKTEDIDWSLFKKPIPRIAIHWVVISISAFALVLLTFIMIESLSGKAFTGLFMLGLTFCAWSAITLHCRFEQTMVTTLAGLFGLMLLLIASGFISPKEAADTLRDYLSKD